MTTVSGALQGVQQFLADGGDSPSDVDPTTGKGPEWGEAAPIGLLVIVLLCVAVYFLVKSMNRNLKKVPTSFATESVLVGANTSPGAADGTAEATTTTTARTMSEPVRSAEADRDAQDKTDPPAPSSTP